MNRIVITVEGGLVQAVNADEPVEVTVIDFDVENDEADDVKTVGDSVAAIGQYESDPMNDACRAWLAAAKE